MALIETERLDEAIVRWTFNRAEKLNAMNLEMYGELRELVDEAEQDDAVKVVILRGAGRSFCAGQDLAEVGFMYGFGKEAKERRPSQRRRLAIDRRWANDFLRFHDFSKVSILQVHGHCLGSGFDLLLLGDLVVAAPDAQLGHPGLRMVGPGLNYELTAWYEQLGSKLAKEMLFTGRILSGEEGLEKGLVNRLAPEQELDSAALELAQEIALMPADGIVMGKEATRMTAEFLGVRSGLLFGATSHSFNTNVRFDPGEFNFFRERREKGPRDAFHERDDRYTKP
jgi:enoyl-CoA hydratase/carnithine racemase